MSVGPVKPVGAPTPQSAEYLSAARARPRQPIIMAPGAPARSPQNAVLSSGLLRNFSPAAVPVLANPAPSRAGPVSICGYDEHFAIVGEAPDPALPDRAALLAAGAQALRSLAASRGQTPEEVARDTKIVADDLLPSRNSNRSEATIRTQLLMRGDKGEEVAVDLYVARTGAHGWEICAFDQAARAAESFPYSAPPLFVATAAFDPLLAEFALSGILASFQAPRIEQTGGPGLEGSAGYLRAAIKLAALAGLLGLAIEGRPLSALILAFVAIAGLRLISPASLGGPAHPSSRAPAPAEESNPLAAPLRRQRQAG